MPGYLRKGRPYSPAEIFRLMPPEFLSKGHEDGIRTLDGDAMHFTSLRYYTFKKDLCCAACGIEGTYFVKETTDLHKPVKRYHLNLYAVLEGGEEVLMTKDHIWPRSKGGTDDLDNLQTMCAPCNAAKGSVTPGLN